MGGLCLKSSRRILLISFSTVSRFSTKQQASKITSPPCSKDVISISTDSTIFKFSRRWFTSLLVLPSARRVVAKSAPMIINWSLAGGRDQAIKILADSSLGISISFRPSLKLSTCFEVVSHSLYPRSSKTGKGGTGHLSKQDGTSYFLDTGNAQAVEIQPVQIGNSEKFGGPVIIGKSDSSFCLRAAKNGAGAKTVTYPVAYKQAPALAFAIDNMASGDKYDVTSKTATSFVITFRNSSGSAVSRTFDYIAKGF